MKLQEHIIILKTKKYPKLIAEKGIEKALAVPWEQLSSEKMKNNNISPFISIHIYI